MRTIKNLELVYNNVTEYMQMVNITFGMRLIRDGRQCPFEVGITQGRIKVMAKYLVIPYSEVMGVTITKYPMGSAQFNVDGVAYWTGPKDAFLIEAEDNLRDKEIKNSKVTIELAG